MSIDVSCQLDKLCREFISLMDELLSKGVITPQVYTELCAVKKRYLDHRRQ